MTNSRRASRVRSGSSPSARFEYHNDPEKTAGAFNERGWSTLGDVGYLDDDGYLFLTDRVSHMIIAGGVNIYPAGDREPPRDASLGGRRRGDRSTERGPRRGGEGRRRAGTRRRRPTTGSAHELIAYCRDHLAHYKCPVSIDFVDDLPRLPTGKLLKRDLRERYWA